jgi:hypothetical protein
MPVGSCVEDHSAFDTDEITIVLQAFEDACAALQISHDQLRARDAIAARIIDLARSGVLDAKALSGRVVAEAKLPA